MEDKRETIGCQTKIFRTCLKTTLLKKGLIIKLFSWQRNQTQADDMTMVRDFDLEFSEDQKRI